MNTVLHGRQIVLGVTGSIACFKAADLASKLVQQGAVVDVILTAEASRFITPLTFQALTHRPVITNLFDPQAEIAMDHVALALRADLIVICPATAHTIARLSLGLADDALTTTVLASTAPLVIVPAMDAHMFQHATVQEHLERLRARGAHIVGPVEGRLASGLVGKGRMAEVVEIADHLHLIENARRKLAAKSLHLIVVNDVSAPDGGFGAHANRVVIIDRAGAAEALPLLPKTEVARRVLDRVAELLTRPRATGSPSPPA